MIEQGFVFYILIAMLITVLLVVSFIIPFYGFVRHRLRGAFLGCLLQPFVCGVACLMAIVGIVVYQRCDVRRHRQAAMVTVRETVEDSIGALSYVWHLKADEECLLEIAPMDGSRMRPDPFHRTKLFDVVPTDSCSVTVDDRIVVAFDLNDRKATATDYGTPIEVVRVDWDRVDRFFRKREEGE
jgi:hypothetical protein